MPCLPPRPTSDAPPGIPDPVRPPNRPGPRVPAPLLRDALAGGRVRPGHVLHTVRQAAEAEMRARGWPRPRRRRGLARILRFLRSHRRRPGLPAWTAPGRTPGGTLEEEALVLLYRDVLGLPVDSHPGPGRR